MLDENTERERVKDRHEKGVRLNDSEKERSGNMEKALKSFVVIEYDQ